MKLLFIILLVLCISSIAVLADVSEDRTDYYNDGTYYITDNIESSDEKGISGLITYDGNVTSAHGWQETCTYSDSVAYKGSISVNCSDGSDPKYELASPNASFTGILGANIRPSGRDYSGMTVYDPDNDYGIVFACTNSCGEAGATKWKCYENGGSWVTCTGNINVNYDTWNDIKWNFTAGDAYVYVDGIYLHTFANIEGIKYFVMKGDGADSNFNFDDVYLHNNNTRPEGVGNNPPATPTIDNTSGLNYYKNITINFSSTDADADPITYYLFSGTSNPPTTQVYSGNEGYYTTQWTSDDTYFFSVIAGDGEDNSSTSSVYNATLDTILPAITVSIENNSWFNDNVTALAVMEDLNPYNLSILCDNKDRIHNATPDNTTIQLGFTTGFHDDGEYRCEFNGSDKHTDNDFPDIASSYSAGTLTYYLIDNPGNNIILNFAYMVNDNVKPVTQTQIDNYNMNKYELNLSDRINFGFEADTPGQDVKFGFTIKKRAGLYLIDEDDNALFHFKQKYWLDFKGFVTNLDTTYKYYVSPNVWQNTTHYGIYYNLVFSDYGLSQYDRFRFSTESIGGLNVIDIFHNYNYDGTSPSVTISIDDDTPYHNQQITLTSVVTETNPNDCNFTHNMSGTIFVIEETITGGSCTTDIDIHALKGAVINFSVYASDLASSYDMESIIINVTNAPPTTPTWFNDSGQSYTTNQTFGFNSTDADNDTIYFYLFSEDSDPPNDLVYYGTDTNYTTDWTSPDIYYFRVIASDLEDNSTHTDFTAIYSSTARQPSALSFLECPDTLQGMSIIYLMIIISMLFIIIALASNILFFGLIGSILLLIGSFYFAPCESVFASGLMVISITLIIYFPLKSFLSTKN